MEFGCINIKVYDPESALDTYLKMFGTNNIEKVIRLKGLDDTSDIVDGYYLRTKPVNVGLFRPRSTTGRMGKSLDKEGQ